MGTWGTGLYSDDTACDVRDDYMDILGDGIAEPEATNQLLKQWNEELSDPDTGPVFWLALAETQWKLGRLQEQVKEKAIQVINDGSDLARWEVDPKQAVKRKQVMERVKQKITSTQPAEKKVKKRFVEFTTWQLGEVYSYKLLSGKYSLFHVIGFHKDKGGRRPMCEVLDWTGLEIPNKRNIRKLGYKYANEPNQHLSQFVVGALGPDDKKDDRLNLVAKNKKSKRSPGGFSAINWKDADKQLKLFFDFD